MVESITYNLYRTTRTSGTTRDTRSNWARGHFRDKWYSWTARTIWSKRWTWTSWFSWKPGPTRNQRSTWATRSERCNRTSRRKGTFWTNGSSRSNGLHRSTWQTRTPGITRISRYVKPFSFYSSFICNYIVSFCNYIVSCLYSCEQTRGEKDTGGKFKLIDRKTLTTLWLQKKKKYIQIHQCYQLLFHCNYPFFFNRLFRVSLVNFLKTERASEVNNLNLCVYNDWF